MTDEGIRLEYEAHLAAMGEPLKTCPKCGVETHRKSCPVCVVGEEALTLSGDTVIDQALLQSQKGEQVDMAELEKALRGGFVKMEPGEKP